MDSGTSAIYTPSSGTTVTADEQIRFGIELMYFAYRSFTAEPDRILAKRNYGRAHHRALHFIGRKPGLTVNELLDTLGVTKQSLNRVLRQLIDDRIVESRVGANDRRQRHLHLTEDGISLAAELSETQRNRMRLAFEAVGPEAVQGFERVMEHIVDADLRELLVYPGEGCPA
ncbi:MAG: MarR family transcriptional regulator [Pseudomonadota bacterium]